MSYLPSGQFTPGYGPEGVGQFRSDLGLSWGDVKSFGSKIGGSALDIYKSQQQQAGAAKAAQEIAMAQAAAAAGQKAPGKMPGWVIPAGIGAAALVLIIALKK